jgi:hypothetical protein
VDALGDDGTGPGVKVEGLDGLQDELRDMRRSSARTHGALFELCDELWVGAARDEALGGAVVGESEIASDGARFVEIGAVVELEDGNLTKGLPGEVLGRPEQWLAAVRDPAASVLDAAEAFYGDELEVDAQLVGDDHDYRDVSDARPPVGSVPRFVQVALRSPWSLRGMTAVVAE